MWQTILGRCIYTSPSGCKVFDNLFYRWLTFGNNALQTVLNKKNPRRPVLYYLPDLTLMARTSPGSVCLLGAGGAGLAHYIASNEHEIVAIDKNTEVIDIALRFFMADSIPNFKLLHHNAIDFLRRSTARYSHLIIDLYNANHFPEECKIDDFFLLCKNSLNTDGFLSVNLANIQEQYTLFMMIQKHFKNTLVIPIRRCSNMVLIASNHEDRASFIEMILQKKEVKKIMLEQPWGHVGLTAINYLLSSGH